MTEQDILQLRDLAEAGQVQFKERIVSKDDKYEIGCEMVAFSNSRGGKLIIAINDKSGKINALSYMELQETTNLLTNITFENALAHRSLNIKAPIRIFIFDNRVEIHSLGALPNGLTVEDIKNGTSMPRNMFLFTGSVSLSVSEASSLKPVDLR